MELPGEKHAWWVIESSLTSAHDKAEARVKLAEIEGIRRRNEESERAWNNGGREAYYNSLR